MKEVRINKYLLGTIFYIYHLNAQKQAHRYTHVHGYTMNKIIKQS